MSLKSTILSYTPSHYYPADTPFPASGKTISNEGDYADEINWDIEPIRPVLVSDGGPDGAGSWAFQYGSYNQSDSSGFRKFGDTILNDIISNNSNSYSCGIWVKINPPSSGNFDSSLKLIQVGGHWMASIIVNYNPNTSSVTIQSISAEFTEIFTNLGIDDGNWHYLALIVTEDPNFPGQVLAVRGFFDGSQIFYQDILGSNSENNLEYFAIGDNFVLGTTDYTDLIEFAHIYIDESASTIDSTAIANIWAAGTAPPSANVTLNVAPLNSTNALFFDPTIVTTQSAGHVEVVTVIPVSAILTEPVVIAETNIYVSGPITLTANAEIVNNVSVNTPTDVQHVADAATAEAFFQQGIGFPESPFTAVAESGNHQVSVTPSYFKTVVNSSPYAYFPYPQSTYPTVTDTINNVGYYDARVTGLQSYGTQDIATYTVGDDLLVSESPDLLSEIGDGLSWFGTPYSNSPNNFVSFQITNAAESFWNTAVKNGVFTYETWVNFAGGSETAFSNNLFTVKEHNVFVSAEKYTEIIFNPVFENYISNMFVRQYVANNPPETITEYSNTYRQNIDVSGRLCELNQWTHVVVRFEQDPVNVNRRIMTIFKNNTVWHTETIYNKLQTNLGWDTSFTDTNLNFNILWPYANTHVDEVAIYDFALGNSEISGHYNFLTTFSPNLLFNSSVVGTASANIVDPQITPSFSLSYPTTSAIASADIVQPSIVAEIPVTVFTTELLAAAQLNEPFFYGDPDINIFAEPMVCTAELGLAWFVNDVYYQNVQLLTSPYRYVTFDGANEAADYGSDTHFGNATPTIINGSILPYGNDFTGKAAVTSGLDYTNNGIVLMESQHDDDWGTGTDTYHSTFWMQRAESDTSTGLRVLWNLNGHYDNQHVILYEYNNKLHIVLNNGSGTFIEAESANNVNLFDGERHFVVIGFDHTGVNNFVNVWVDTINVLSVDMGQYTDQTINGIVFAEPNSEVNNYPRLGIGELITPIGSAVLPVNPSAPTIHFDEITWSKQDITSTQMVALFNAMPDVNNNRVIAQAMDATAIIIDASISSGSNIPADSLNANASSSDAMPYVVFNNLIFADEFALNNAEMLEASISVRAIINSDIMVASANFGASGVDVGIGSGAMTANAELLLPLINNRPITQYSDYIRYLREQNSMTTYQFAYREVN